jgi:hypothetical protein
MPELPLDDGPAGVAYYRDVLGFEINYQQGDLGVMDRDEVRILLIARTPRHRGFGSAYVYVADAAMYGYGHSTKAGGRRWLLSNVMNASARSLIKRRHALIAGRR